ncbi:RING-type E3 ubiquitin transferase [Ranunculus cassubicifolius]
MNQLPLFIILIFLFLYLKAEAQCPPPIRSNDKTSSFRPSVAVVIGVLSIMFSLTFLLLIYAKFCHASTSDLLHRRNGIVHPPGLLRSNPRRFSGIDKAVIESLPFFRFSSLRGSKDGLECAVCLSKFEDTETLRLLPKCKHAFHVNCVDKWLENHSSCPLCRLKVDPQDISIFMYSSSMRISRTQSDLSEDRNLELFVRRETENGGSFSVGSSFRMIENIAQDGMSVQETGNMSDIEVKNRWSDVKSEDLLFLNSKLSSNDQAK